ncbi:hypothetical protein ACET3Z_005984 [Daucus carota]
MEIASLFCAFPIFVFLLFCMIMYVVYDLCLKAKILRAKLQKQGIDGPVPGLVYGNISDIQKIKLKVSAADASTCNLNKPLSLDCRSILLPHISQWTEQFGKTFTFALGKVQILYVGHGELVKEMSYCKSLDLGKPSYLQKDRGPLLGKGILTTSKEVWAHQRNTIAPTLYVNKVKNMLSIVLESGNTLVKSWEKMVETGSGIADIRVDDYVKNFTSSIFSNVMFGRYDVAHKGLFSKCRDLMEASGSPTVLDGRPFYRFFPTKRNKEQRRLEKEIYWLILELAKKCRMREGESMIQTIVEGAKHGELGSSTPQEFIVDNCKELCIVAMDVPGITAIWGLMLLAMHPEWQARARAEVMDVCGGQTPDAEKLGKMRVLKMIIQEILRLYPGAGFTVRESLADVQIGKKLCVPKAKILRAKLQKQGIDGPKPSFVLGNIPDIQKIRSKVLEADASTCNVNEPLSLDCRSILLPHISQWTKQFGKTFTFALGKVQILYIGDGELVREMSHCQSLDLGKPSYLQKDRGPLLGKGILTTSKEVWDHQRKSIAPTLYMDKVKNMYSIVLESGNTLVKSWEKLIETEGGIADIRVDDYVKKFTSTIFSNVMFGRYDAATKDLFSKCRDLMEASGSPTVLDGRPFYRFFPTKKNKDQWRIEKEIYRSILDLTKNCDVSESKNMIHTLVEASKYGELGSSTPQQFIVDNCKELCIVAMDVPGITGIWGLMLLALHPEWQARARAEVFQVCGGQIPDAEKLGKMRVLKMIIQEILRLYPGVGFTVREALADVQIGSKVRVPKGVNTWIWSIAMHRDPQLWGPDALKFNPERFSNGVSGACKIPQAYIPFGLGPRTCPGKNLGMMELTVMFSLVLANFSFSLSPNYYHVPNFNVLLEPKYGVKLIVQKL